ncbi:exosome complex exonuclease RRP42 isoform X2 [Mycetomoellerius zeteki]|uniref:exosome complex exonuclease RRP42 isoform X2 n=1 Tax=Mycetomoellerius zeteki TaxID=64791 RepID=UPI00084EAABC|nr:PREDICTED: exosome complex exonuclease RRP42-like isoform X2 [Trachymyrmex zeteki]
MSRIPDVPDNSAMLGDRPMSIVRRMDHERERMLGMTDEERAWRKKWLDAQKLAPEEPVYPKGYYEAMYNPIRRFYMAPMNRFENILTPVIGKLSANVTRHFISKMTMSIIAFYSIYYYMKYNRMLNLRNDGRSRYQYRPIEIESKLMKHTHGSARLRIGNITDVLVGVKLEIDTPFAERPDEGKLEFFVDCSANATPAFEGKGGDDLATEISNVLSMAYQTPDAFDLKQLCIIPHQKCWKMYVDILILQCGGNLFDAVGAAVKAALYNTEIPRVITATLDGGEPDIQVSDDPYDCIKLDVTNYPVVLTVCKIGDNFVIDPTSEEESCSTASILMSVMPNGKVTSVVKLGYGSLLPNTLIKMLQVGKDISFKLNEALMKGLEEENKLGKTKPIFGFLR